MERLGYCFHDDVQEFILVVTLIQYQFLNIDHFLRKNFFDYYLQVEFPLETISKYFYDHEYKELRKILQELLKRIDSQFLIVKIIPRNLYSGKRDYEQINRISALCFEKKYKTIFLDFQNVKWIDGDLVAPIEGIIRVLERNNNSIWICNVNNPFVENLLRGNKFLLKYGYKKPQRTTASTIIPLVTYELNQAKEFAEFIDHLFSTKIFSTLSKIVFELMQLTMNETFHNSYDHSQSLTGIQFCGQWYPKKGKIKVSIADQGIGYKGSVNKYFNCNWSAQKCIQWAMEGRNSTKKDEIPGGLGNKIIRKRIEENSGTMTVVSGSGMWQQNENGKVEVYCLKNEYPGTIVTLEYSIDEIDFSNRTHLFDEEE